MRPGIFRTVDSPDKGLRDDRGTEVDARGKSSLNAPTQGDLAAQRIAVGIDDLYRDPRIAAHAVARAPAQGMRGRLGNPDRRARRRRRESQDIRHQRMDPTVDVASQDYLHVHSA